MARVSLTAQSVPKHGNELEDITFTAADDANDHSFVNTGREILLVKNDSGGPLDVTVVSVADEYDRTGDVTISTGASDISAAGPFPTHLFNQSGGVVHVDLTDDTSMSLAVLKLEGA